jgi:hypothetical protein
VGQNGVVSVVDILDLDLWCRARESCNAADTTELLDSSDAVALAVRRHAPRLLSAAAEDPTLSGLDQLATIAAPSTEPVCPGPENYTTLEGDLRVCVPSDPWNQLDQTWTVAREANVPTLNITGAVFADEGEPGTEELGEDQLLLLAPMGVNLCERGLLANTAPPSVDSDPSELSPDALNPQDEIVIVSDPREQLEADCPSPSQGAELRLGIAAAYADRVVVEPRGTADTELLRRCYPDWFNFAVQVGNEDDVQGQYLVLGSASGYLHRVTTREEDGRCVIDTDLDPRFVSRLTPDTLYANPYVAFEVAPGANIPRTFNVRVTAGRTELRDTVYDPNTDFPDALPASVRFFPFRNELFIVDTASQGLRRFALSPFGRTNEIFR